MIGILKGAIPFYGKLIMNLRIECQFEFITLSSFRGELEAIGTPRIATKLLNSIQGRDVVIIEDIIDTARTISKLYKYLRRQKPKSLTTVALIDKSEQRIVPYKVDYACFKIKGNPFVIGYGLDVREIARNLPYIASFKKEYLDKL
ncbi:MAG: hypoxanthine phosphoribosyltransferase [Mycoplasmoidaceae bacterium]|nr:hypoxanthine phosphoribosyltransferase [Mycoplasmoidaceae bacterium]